MNIRRPALEAALFGGHITGTLAFPGAKIWKRARLDPESIVVERRRVSTEMVVARCIRMGGKGAGSIRAEHHRPPDVDARNVCAAPVGGRERGGGSVTCCEIFYNEAYLLTIWLLVNDFFSKVFIWADSSVRARLRWISDKPGTQGPISTIRYIVLSVFA